jgi:hypothetical protein
MKCFGIAPEMAPSGADDAHIEKQPKKINGRAVDTGELLRGRR